MKLEILTILTISSVYLKRLEKISELKYNDVRKENYIIENYR